MIVSFAVGLGFLGIATVFTICLYIFSNSSLQDIFAKLALISFGLGTIFVFACSILPLFQYKIMSLGMIFVSLALIFMGVALFTLIITNILK
jgi:hypothetical protein